MRYLALAVLCAAACTSSSRDLPADRWRGAQMLPPLPKPAATLTATDGRPFDLRAETRGTVTLLFFGYTHCPDVCPVHMANLGAVLREWLPSERERVKVVFVTTDPARDSLPRLRAWLDNFDPAFIGLRGDLDSVNALQAALGLPRAMLGTPDSAGWYEVGHSAVVVAFTPDDSARFVYPFGTRQVDWANDLPQLLAW